MIDTTDETNVPPVTPEATLLSADAMLEDTDVRPKPYFSRDEIKERALAEMDHVAPERRASVGFASLLSDMLKNGESLDSANMMLTLGMVRHDAIDHPDKEKWLLDEDAMRKHIGGF